MLDKINRIAWVLPMMVLIISCSNQNKDMTDKTAPTEAPLKGWPDPARFTDSVDGKAMKLFHLRNSSGYRAVLCNYGARLVGFWMPDSKGQMTDIVLGFDNSKSYLEPTAKFFGSVVGRYGNRIAKGTFTMDGKKYTLNINNGQNSLHGGPTGFHSRVWEGTQIDSQHVRFTYRSPDGEEGYPGNLDIAVTYSLNNTDELFMEYEVTTDKKTVINVTNHSFWNLNGEGSGTVLDHELMLASSSFTEIDSTLIPRGVIPAGGTPFDFSKPMKMGAKVGAEHIQLLHGKGYDHNFVLDSAFTGKPVLAARVKGDKSGIVMEVYTTEPAIQFYGGNFMKGLQTLKSGAKDEYRTAFCLETQHYPDSPNHPEFPTTVLEPGQKYVSTTYHRFLVEGTK